MGPISVKSVKDFDIVKQSSDKWRLTLDRKEIMNRISRHFEVHDDAPSTNSDWYKITKTIGKGSFGKVVLGTHKLTGK